MSNEEREANGVVENQEQNDAFTPVVSIRNVDYPFSYTEEQVDKFTKKYFIKVDGELYNALERSVYFKTKGKYSIPGFRKGKATMASIKTFYGSSCFIQDTVDEAIDELYRVLYRPVFIKSHMACNPDVEIKSIGQGEFEFAYIITSYAPVENLVYSDIEYKGTKIDTIQNEAYERLLNTARENAGSWEEITDRAVALGDTANIDYCGKFDGVAFEGGSAEGYDLVLGSNTFIPGFEDQVVGMNVGETKDVVVSFPEDYGYEAYQGKEAVFTVKLNSAKVKVLPELDDDFAKDVSEFDTLEELKASYQAKAKEEAEERVKNANEQALIEAIVEANNYELPEKAIEELTQGRVDEFADRLASSKLSLDDYLGYVGMTKEQFVERNRLDVIKEEKQNMILSAIVEAEDIKVEENEVEDRIKANAEKAGKDIEDYRKEVNAREAQYIYSQIISEKLIARLEELNKIVYQD